MNITRKIVKKWVGREANKDQILSDWSQPINKAKALSLPLYCGEFGVITETPVEDR